jgi:lysophospholipase L1-like esterase
MRRVGELTLALAAIGCCACESSAPASTRRADRPVPATDWAGVRTPSRGTAEPQAPAGEGTWVLHIGDSFADASFQQNIGPRIRASGARYVVQATTATYTSTWAYDPELDELLGRKPSLVIVTLGANEVDMPVPSVHAGAVERIARKIDAAGASCVWTTPPLWKGDDTGILQVIHDHCSPCVYFDSDAVLGGLHADERQPDRIHPNKRGGARWADAFWSWLDDHRDRSRPGWAVLPFERREP